MPLRSIVFILLSLWTFNVGAGAGDTELPIIKLMPKMHAEWAGKQMIYNGVPMSIRTFSVDKPPEDVLRYYEREWQARHVGESVRTSQGEVEVLGFRVDDVYYSIQASAKDGGTSGALVVTGALENYEHSRKTEFPLPSNTQVVTRMEAYDRGKVSETITVTSERRVDALVDETLAVLAAQGWQIHSKTASDDAQAQVYSLQRGRELCQLTFVDQTTERATTLLVHWVKE